MDVVDLLERCGRPIEAIDRAAEAFGVAQASGDLAAQAMAAVEFERATHLGSGLVAKAAVMLERVLRSPGELPPEVRTRVCASLGRAKMLSDNRTVPP